MVSARSETAWGLFEASCSRFRDRPMLYYNDQMYTYGEIERQALAFEALIGTWDFRMGGVCLPNRPEFLSAMLGLNKAGKPMVILSSQYKREALAELIDFTDVELLVTDSKGWETLQSSLDRTNVRTVLVLREDGGFGIAELSAKPARTMPGIDENTFGICFTSGSTARPKGIVLSNRAIAGNALSIARHLGNTHEDCTIVPRSLAQASPLAGDVLMTICRGGAVILLNNVFHPAIFLKAIQDYRATQFFAVRTMLQQAMEYPKFHAYDVSSVKRVMLGGMMNPPSVFQTAAAKFPAAKVYNAYGASEAVSRVTFGEHDDVLNHPYTIGRPIHGCSLSVRREDGSEADVGETGELYVRSDFQMEGYYKSVKQTEEALTPAGFRVKDVGYRDGNGLYYVLGRNDDLITQGGTLAYPVDIEEALQKHPAVSESLVIGVEDDKLGQRIVALVSLKPDSPAEVRDLHRWCLSLLEDRKAPKQILIVDSIPRNAIGKINKQEVFSLYRHLINREEAV